MSSLILATETQLDTIHIVWTARNKIIKMLPSLFSVYSLEFTNNSNVVNVYAWSSTFKPHKHLDLLYWLWFMVVYLRHP